MSNKENNMSEDCILKRTIVRYMARFDGAIPKIIADSESPCHGMNVHRRDNGELSIKTTKDVPYSLCEECVRALQKGTAMQD